jgi:DNA repair exonuclease SbcCD ATPase subunit
MPNRHNELTAEVNTLQNKIQNLEASKAQLYTTYLDKCREYEELMDEYQSRVNNPNTELQRLKIENMEISKMSEIVNEQLSLARDRIHYLDAIMIEKDSYIEAMEDMQQFETTNQTIKELEERCMQLLREKSELARDYDNAIRHLESSMAESREKSMSQSMMFSVSPRNRKTTFDEALRQQIQ